MVDLSVALTEDLKAQSFDVITAYLKEAEKRTGLNLSDFNITGSIDKGFESYTIKLSLDAKHRSNADTPKDSLRFAITIRRKKD